jgi:hypothetical protein
MRVAAENTKLLILAVLFNAPVMTLRSRLFGPLHQRADALPYRRTTLVKAAAEEKMALVVEADCYCTADECSESCRRCHCTCKHSA